jgi:hypothetical protein
MKTDGTEAVSEEQQYAALQARNEELLTQARELCSEAYRARDERAVWEMTATIAHLERLRDGMRKPG